MLAGEWIPTKQCSWEEKRLVFTSFNESISGSPIYPSILLRAFVYMAAWKIVFAMFCTRVMFLQWFMISRTCVKRTSTMAWFHNVHPCEEIKKSNSHMRHYAVRLVKKITSVSMGRARANDDNLKWSSAERLPLALKCTPNKMNESSSHSRLS